MGDERQHYERTGVTSFSSICNFQWFVSPTASFTRRHRRANHKGNRRGVGGDVGVLKQMSKTQTNRCANLEQRGGLEAYSQITEE